jgi:hypothetical protein
LIASSGELIGARLFEAIEDAQVIDMIRYLQPFRLLHTAADAEPGERSSK